MRIVDLENHRRERLELLSRLVWQIYYPLVREVEYAVGMCKREGLLLPRWVVPGCRNRQAGSLRRGEKDLLVR